MKAVHVVQGRPAKLTRWLGDHIKTGRIPSAWAFGLIRQSCRVTTPSYVGTMLDVKLEMLVVITVDRIKLALLSDPVLTD